MRVVDVPEVLELLDEIVQQFGEDHFYTRQEGEVACLNWHDIEGKPGCIIGWLMHKLGASDDQLSRCSQGGASRLAGFVGEALEIEFTDRAIVLMGMVQSYQDNGVTWSKCVTTAKKELDRRSKLSGRLVGAIW